MEGPKRRGTSSMEAEVIETEVSVDKPLEDLTVEELQQVYDQSSDGETEISEPEEVEEVAAETSNDSEELGENDDSNEATTVDPMEAMMKEMKGLQKMFARTQTELGELRKTNAQTVIDEDVDPYTDPDKFFDKKMEARENKKAESLASQQAKLDETKSYVEARVPKFGDMVDDMSVELKSLLGDEPDADLYVSNFKENPYVVDPLTLLFAGRTAELKREIAKLQGKASKSENGKGDLIKKINNLGRNRSTVNGSGSNASSNGSVRASLSRNQIESEGMTVEKLQAQYEQMLEQ